MDKAFVDACSGRLDSKLPPPSNIARVYISTAGKDTVSERRALHQQVIPHVRQYAREEGIDVVAYDLHLGVPSEGIGAEEACRVVRRCCEGPIGTCFVSLANHTAGQPSLPSVINAEAYDLLIKKVTDDSDVLMLQSWYTKDENAVPPVYVRKPIREKLPAFFATSDKKSAEIAAKQDRERWQTQSKQMLTALQQAMDKIAGDVKGSAAISRSQFGSLLEKEHVIALQHCQKRTLYWVHRTFENLTAFKDEAQASGLCDHDQEAITRLRQQLDKHVDSDQRCELSIKWSSSSGVDVANNQDHKAYITKMATSLEDALKLHMETALRKRPQEYALPHMCEVVSHLHLAKAHTDGFAGRTKLINQVKEAVQLQGDLCVLHGQAATGKTALVAKLSQVLAEKGGDTVVVTRFVGTTPASSTAAGILESVDFQLAVACGHPTPSHTSLSTTVKRLRERLKACNKNVVILLDDAQDIRVLSGIVELSNHENVHLVLCMQAPSAQDALTHLKELPQARSAVVIEVPKLNGVEASDAFDVFLKANDRKLSQSQTKTVTAALSSGASPLVARIVAATACTWTSADKPKTLPNKVTQAVDVFFDGIEGRHGKTLTSRVLALLAASRYGLSEVELLDVLSVDEEAMDAALDPSHGLDSGYSRFPPLMLSRILHDLSSMLVTSFTEDCSLSNFRSPTMRRIAQKRYLSGGANASVHNLLAELFIGQWYDEKKPASGTSTRSPSYRLLPASPIQYTGEQPRFNARRLSVSAYHFMHADQVEKLDAVAFFDLTYLLGKIASASVQDLLEELSEASAMKENKDRALLRQALLLGQHTLSVDPQQLAGQLLGRLSGCAKDSSLIKALLEAAEKHAAHPSTYSIAPSSACIHQPGDHLQISHGAHADVLSAVCVSSDGSAIVSASFDGSVHIWNHQLQHQRTMRVEDDASEVLACAISSSTKLVAFATARQLELREYETGKAISAAVVRGCSALAFSKDGESLVAGTLSGAVVIVSTKTGEVTKTFATLAENEAQEVDGVTLVAFLDSGAVAALTGEGSVFVWPADAADAAQPSAVANKQALGRCVVAGGRFLVVAHSDQPGQLQFADLSSASTELALKPFGPSLDIIAGVANVANTRVMGMAVSQNTNLFAVALSSRRTVAVLDVSAASQGSDLESIVGRFVGGASVPAQAVAIAVSDGSSAVVAGDDRELYSWSSLPEKEALKKHRIPAQFFAISAGHHSALTVGAEDAIFWDLGTGRATHDRDVVLDAPCMQLCGLPDSSEAVAVSKTGWALANIEDGNLQRCVLKSPAQEPSHENGEAVGSGEEEQSSAAPSDATTGIGPAEITCAARMVTDPCHLALALSNGTIVTVDPADPSGHPIKQCSVEETPCCLASTSKAPLIGLFASTAQVKFWNAELGETASSSLPSDNFRALGVAESGKVVVGADDGKFLVLSGVDAAVQHEFSTTHGISYIQLADDYVLLWSRSGATLFNLDTKTAALTLEAKPYEYSAVTCTGTGLIVTCDAGAVMRVWNVHEKACVASLTLDEPATQMLVAKPKLASSSAGDRLYFCCGSGWVSSFALPSLAKERAKKRGISMFGNTGFAVDLAMVKAAKNKLKEVGPLPAKQKEAPTTPAFQHPLFRAKKLDEIDEHGLFGPGGFSDEQFDKSNTIISQRRRAAMEAANESDDAASSAPNSVISGKSGRASSRASTHRGDDASISAQPTEQDLDAISERTEESKSRRSSKQSSRPASKASGPDSENTANGTEGKGDAAAKKSCCVVQ